MEPFGEHRRQLGEPAPVDEAHADQIAAWFKYGSQQFLHDLQVIAYWLFCPLLYSAFICEICGPEFGTSSPIG